MNDEFLLIGTSAGSVHCYQLPLGWFENQSGTSLVQPLWFAEAAHDGSVHSFLPLSCCPGVDGGDLRLVASCDDAGGVVVHKVAGDAFDGALQRLTARKHDELADSQAERSRSSSPTNATNASGSPSLKARITWGEAALGTNIKDEKVN